MVLGNESDRTRYITEWTIKLEKLLDKPRAQQQPFLKARVQEMESRMNGGKRMPKGTTLTFIVR